MGRRPRAGVPATKRITIRVTEEEYAKMSKAAAGVDQDLVEWLRRAELVFRHEMGSHRRVGNDAAGDYG